MAKSREELLKFAQRKYVEVEGVRLQSLTELERTNLQAIWGQRYAETQKVDYVMRRELLVLCIVDDSGNRLFDLSEVDIIGSWDAEIVEKLHDAATELCGMNEKDGVDSTEKKSEGIPDSD